MIDLDQHIVEYFPIVGRHAYWVYDNKSDIIRDGGGRGMQLHVGSLTSPNIPRGVVTLPDKRLEWNDSRGISHAVLFPTVAMHIYRAVPQGSPEETDYCLAYWAAVKHWNRAGLIPVRLLPGHPALALAVIAAMPITNRRRAWLLPACPQVNYGVLDSWGPVWATIRDDMVAFHLHYGSSGQVGRVHPVATSLGFAAETQLAAADFILSGVLDRHRGIRCLVAEVGVRWLEDLRDMTRCGVDLAGVAGDYLDAALERGQVLAAEPRIGARHFSTDCPHRAMLDPGEVAGGEQEQAAGDTGGAGVEGPVPGAGVEG